jgi:uncharacterized protein (DUF305 family)
MQDHHRSHNPYRGLVVMTVLSFAAMYALMYAMVDRFTNVYANVNQVYMAGLMTAAMVLIELAVMRTMYQNRRLNMTIGIVATVAGVILFLLIREQAAVGDEQFLKSMIPHHASALLMCREAPIDDLDIRDLCQRILAGQEEEIAEMKAKLDELEGS